MKTRQAFIDAAVRSAERLLQVPPGWWGTWSVVTDGVVRVWYSRSRKRWVITTVASKVEIGSRYSRNRAIAAAAEART